MRVAPLFFVATLCGAAVAPEPKEVTYQGFLTPTNTTPTFDKGYLLVYDADKDVATIDVYAPDGSELYKAAPQVRDARFALIQNAAVDVDGTMAGAVEYARAASRGGGIAIFDSSGKQVRFFDTGRYLPTQVCFAQDHTIWTLGWQYSRPGGENQDYFILRNYSQDGQEIAATLPRSSLETEPDPVGPMIGMWQLRIMGDRIGALLYESSILQPGQARRSMQWVEADLKGKVLERWDVSEQEPAAFTRSGALYAHSGDAVLIFDRTKKAWRRVGGAPNGTLLGADGNNLVFLIRGTSTLRWVRAGE